MEKKYRINTNISKDKVVQVNLQQKVDTLEILSLKLKQEELYRLHEANYGVIVGRVLANDAFGVPNARISVFIQVDPEEIDELKSIYPYTTTNSKDKNNIRYNLLPSTSNDICYRVVGTLPSKEMLLDNDVQIEIFDKYLKYTTVTNNAGDYMLYGVPTGAQELHMSLDLSDIGLLSQKPIDMIYKGYNENEFDSPTQFKSSTNLADLPQIIQQNTTVNVYPLWGDRDESMAAITRADIDVNYKFEPTCVFLGSIVSDNGNSIGHKCEPSLSLGKNKQLVTGTGTIEMIRKTTNGLVEQYQINGNRLIDEDGVWCYQIPMNLDYVSTDEYGNIVPSKNPNQGIPTRARVRFRISKDDTGEEGFSKHTAKYLVPNNPNVEAGGNQFPTYNGIRTFDKHFEFGSSTLEEDFRDLYWNNVYSVKNYIPRLQFNYRATTDRYIALKSANDVDGQNEIPFSKAKFNLPFIYVLICILINVFLIIVQVINVIISALVEILELCIPVLDKLVKFKICIIKCIKPFGFLAPVACPGHYIVRPLLKLIGIEFKCIEIQGLATNANTIYLPGCLGKAMKEAKCPDDVPKCNKDKSVGNLMDIVQQKLAEYYNIIHLDFYNDWINGTLYMPLWYWKKRKKKTFLFGLFSIGATNTYCSCNKTSYGKGSVRQHCATEYTGTSSADKISPKALSSKEIEDTGWHKKGHFGRVNVKRGIIKEFTNRDGARVYYYTPMVPEKNYDRTVDLSKASEDKVGVVTEFATDIILIGNLNENNIDGIPQLYKYLPPTSSNVIPIATVVEGSDGEAEDEGHADDEEGAVSTTGMDWGRKGEEKQPKYSSGLLMDLACYYIDTKAKTCINVDRISEFGVEMDMNTKVQYAASRSLVEGEILPDGMITKFELFADEYRAMFATLNHNGFVPTDENVFYKDEATGYYKNKFKFLYPTNFDGRMSKIAESFVGGFAQKTFDEKSLDYVLFRFGDKPMFYEGNKFPLFRNSYYFYFGLNPGKTAIEKFSSKYTAICQSNQTLPFQIDITKQTKSSCDGLINPYIWVDIPDIEKPYSYVLYDSKKRVVDNATELEFDGFGIGVPFKDANNFEEINEKSGFKDKSNRWGAIYDLTNPEHPQKGDLRLENQDYTIVITDANGNKNQQVVRLIQEPISITYTKVDLGKRFYNVDITTKEEICNDNQTYGKVRIDGITIDDIDYTFANIEITDYSNGIITGTTNVDSKLGQSLEFKLKVTPMDENFSMDECGCGGSNPSKLGPGPGENFGNVQGITFDKVNSNGIVALQMYLYMPISYKVDVTQICNGVELEANKTSIVVTIENGTPFYAYINTVPLRFLLGENNDPSNYNPNFYQKNSSYSTDPSVAARGWFGVHNEKTYKFEPINTNTLPLWSEFVKIDKGTIDTDGGKFDLGVDNSTKILEYKFQRIFNLAGGTYEIADGTAGFNYSTTGGQSPVLQKAAYPNYSGLSVDGDKDTNMIINEASNSRNESTMCNIVPDNYAPVNDNIRNSFNRIYNAPNFNPYHKDKKGFIGNYFAAFTKNGGIIDSSTGQENSNIKFESVPYLAKPRPRKKIGPDSLIALAQFGNSSIFKSKDKEYKHFRALTVDRRIDYDMLILAPIYQTETKYSNDEQTNKWMFYGRMSGQTYNGLEMSFEDPYGSVRETPTFQTVVSLLGKLGFDYSTEDAQNQLISTFIENSEKIEDAIESGSLDSLNLPESIKQFSISTLKTVSSKINEATKELDRQNNVISVNRDLNGNTITNTNVEYSYDIKTCNTILNENPVIPRTLFSANVSGIEVRKMFWSTEPNKQYALSNYVGNPAVSPNNVWVFDHRNDRNLYNGAFGINNYPTKRLLDIGLIPPNENNTFNIDLISCDYNQIDVEVDEDSGEIIGKTSGGEGVMTEITLDDKITFIKGENGDQKPNVFAYVKDNLFYPYFTDITYNLTAEGSNSHNVIFKYHSQIPVTSAGNNKTYYLAELKKKRTYNEFINYLNELYKKMGSSKRDSWSGVDGLGHNDVGYVTKDGDLLNVDDDDASKIIWNKSFGWQTKKSWFRTKYFIVKTPLPYESMCLVFERDYKNNDEDCLTKHLRSFSFSPIYDLRPIDLKVFRVDFIKGADIPGDPPPEPEDGGEEEQQPEPEKQDFTRVIFKVNCSSGDYLNLNLNQAFYNVQNISCVASFSLQTGSFKITNATLITNDNIDEYNEFDSVWKPIGRMRINESTGEQGYEIEPYTTYFAIDLPPEAGDIRSQYGGARWFLKQQQLDINGNNGLRYSFSYRCNFSDSRTYEIRDSNL